MKPGNNSIATMRRCEICGRDVSYINLVHRAVCPRCIGLILTDRIGDWISDGLCGQMDPEMWFRAEHARATKRAKKICMECPVREQCLEWASKHEEEGVWGGVSKSERRRSVTVVTPQSAA